MGVAATPYGMARCVPSRHSRSPREMLYEQSSALMAATIFTIYAFYHHNMFLTPLRVAHPRQRRRWRLTLSGASGGFDTQLFLTRPPSSRKEEPPGERRYRKTADARDLAFS